MSPIELWLRWEGRDPAVSDDARKLSQFVNGLVKFDPVYESWLRSPNAKKPVLSTPLREADAERLLRERIAHYDVPRKPWPESGSSFYGGHAGPAPYDFSEARLADTHFRIGAFSLGTPLPNRIIMRLAACRRATHRSWRASELRPLMKFARAIWRPVEMCAIFSHAIGSSPKVPDPTWAAGERPLSPRIGWITYLPPDLAARAQYPSDVEVETLDDGGALVTLCEEPFDRTDTRGLARLHALEAALRPLQS
jgi:hypothetical protein